MKEKMLSFTQVRYKDMIHFNSILGGIIIFLLGRAVLFETISPFGLAFLAAYISENPKKIYSSTVIGLIGIAGCMTVFTDVQIIKYSLAYVLFSLIYVSVTTLSDTRKNYAVSAMAGVSLLISGIIFSAQTGFVFYDVVMLMLESIACAVLVVIMEKAVPVIYEKNKSADERLIYFYTMIAFCILGFSGITIGNISISNTICILIIMVLAYCGGISTGCIGGIAVGAISGMSTFPLTEMLGVYSLCGLCAGILYKYKKAGVLLGFVIANALLSMYLGGFDSGAFTAYELFIAAVIFLMLPEGATESIKNLITSTVQSEKVIKINHTINKRLSYVAEAFENLSASWKELAIPKTKIANHDITCIFDKTADKICLKCGQKFNCWEKEYNTTYDVMVNLIPVLKKNGKVEYQDFPSFFTGKCMKIVDFIRELNSQYEACMIDFIYEQRICESQNLIASQFQNVSEIIHNLAEEKEEIPTIQKEIDIYCSVSAKKKDGQHESGDSFAYQPLCDEKYIMVLSDGMGTGKNAAKQSNTTVSLLRDLLNAGYDKKSAIKMINSVLLVRSTEECFATLDITIIDQVTCECELIKIGANATYIKRENEITTISSTSYPAGILSNVDMETYKAKLNMGDYIIMLSDGVENVCDCWVKEFILKTPFLSENAIADSILQEALSRRNNIAEDDMTVLVAKIV